MRYFGTDGIRDKAEALLASDIPCLLGRALGSACGKVLVARDVRTSSPAIERRLARGLMDGDAQIYLAGVLPTPALAYLADAHDARFAVMITASHNAPQFNGLKVFSRRGQKLSLREEEALDDAIAALAGDGETSGAAFEALAADEQGASERDLPHRAHVLAGAEEEYLEHIVGMFPRYDGEKVTLDCACGCMAGVAKRAFEALGAQVTSINDARDGEKVNVNCGSTHLDALVEATPRDGVGFAFDGDGDRVLAVVDKKPYDGDAILLALSELYRIKGKLRKKIVVGTELANGKLQRELAARNIALLRTPVGDKHVLNALLENGCPLGGEKSGHILMLDRAKTGDGLLTALSLLEAKTVMGDLPRFVPYPMLELDLPCEDPQKELESAEMRAKTALVKEMFGKDGRLILRASGTEPTIRLAFECFLPDADAAFEKVKSVFV